MHMACPCHAYGMRVNKSVNSNTGTNTYKINQKQTEILVTSQEKYFNKTDHERCNNDDKYLENNYSVLLIVTFAK